MKKLGIIGGLGPMATVYLMELIVKMTKADTDQQHIDSIVFNIPSTPDRTAFLLDRSKDSPLVPMSAAAKSLEMLGVGAIAIPCITSHYFYRELSESISIPIINLVEETARYLKDAGVKKAGIMATTGTVSTKLFQSACEKFGLEWAIPSEENQAKVMHLIYDCVKAGNPPEMELFYQVAEELENQGCGAVILGCTELSVIKKLEQPLQGRFLDALEVLARASVLRCGKELTEEYRSLL